jgi:hypothetical protein
MHRTAISTQKAQHLSTSPQYFLLLVVILLLSLPMARTATRLSNRDKYPGLVQRPEKTQAKVTVMLHVKYLKQSNPNKSIMPVESSFNCNSMRSQRFCIAGLISELYLVIYMLFHSGSDSSDLMNTFQFIPLNCAGVISNACIQRHFVSSYPTICLNALSIFPYMEP